MWHFCKRQENSCDRDFFVENSWRFGLNVPSVTLTSLTCTIVQVSDVKVTDGTLRPNLHEFSTKKSRSQEFSCLLQKCHIRMFSYGSYRSSCEAQRWRKEILHDQIDSNRKRKC